LHWRRQRITKRPELADVCVFDNRTVIIEYERRGKAVDVGRQPGDEEGRRERDDAGALRRA
jgi:hypothetical protein